MLEQPALPRNLSLPGDDAPVAPAVSGAVASPARAAVSVLLVGAALTALLLFAGLQATDYHFTYPLDDAYIHLALARTLAQDHLLGINPNSLGAASSSPFWTLGLAALVKVFGPNEWLPLILNGLAGVALLLILERLLRGSLPDWRVRSGAIILIMLVMPLVPLLLSGMEHVAHTAAALLLCWAALRNRPGALAVFLLSALATGLRFETAFVAFGLSCVLLSRRNWATAAAGLGGVAAVALAVGYWQITQGEGLIANSLLAKSVGQPSWPWLLHKLEVGLRNFSKAPLLLTLAVVAALVGFLPRRDGELQAPADRFSAGLTVTFLVAVLLHCFFAAVGWFERYQAYLVVMGLVAVAGPLYRLLASYRPSAEGPAHYHLLLAALVCFGLLIPGYRALGQYFTCHRASRNIHDQQYQLARFIGQYYNDASLVISDIGYIGLLTEAHILDVQGLATREVAVAMATGGLTPEIMTALAQSRQAVLAIGYDLNGIPTDRWPLVCTWEISDNVICGNPTVGFRVIDPAQRPALLHHLREFQPKLPSSVIVTYY